MRLNFRHSFVMAISKAVRVRERERGKKGPGKTETRDKNTPDTYAIWDSIIK